MPSKGFLWGIAYAAFSITSFGVSLFVSASKSYDFLTLSQELTDNFRLTILLNFIVFCFLAFGLLTIWALFRRIRIIEIEHIADNLPFYGLNLLFILFNDNNLLLNMVWTGLTILMKVYHIITYDRVDFLQVQVVNRMSSQHHTKTGVLASFVLNGYVLFLVSLLVADVIIARILAYDIFQGVSSIGSLLFGIQFGVMGIDCFAFLGKLVLNVYELVLYRCTEAEESIDDEDDLDEQIWENRAIYVQSFEIMTSLLKTLFYAVFLYTLYFHSRLSLPIPLIQGCIVSIHSAVKQTYQFMSFLSQSRNLENQLASPSEDDLAVADHMCIICREDMHFPATFSSARGRPLNPRKHPKKLQCGHILHLCCLKDWLERSDSCPLCRKVVFRKPESPRPAGSPENVPQPAPGDRPMIPAATPSTGATGIAGATETEESTEPAGPTERESSTETARPTPTTAVAGLTIVEDSGQSAMQSAMTAMAQSARSNATEPAVRGPAESESPASGQTGPLNHPSFVPRDWASFPLSPTSDKNSFIVRLSATQSARLTIRPTRASN